MFVNRVLHVIYIYIDFPFGVCLDLRGPGLGAAANSETNICLSLSADESPEITRSGITIGRPSKHAAVAPRARSAYRINDVGRTGLREGKWEAELSAALDTNWSGIISTTLFISRLMHYSLFVRIDTYDNAIYVITSDNAIRRTYVYLRSY